ncbi:unnamed protein product [Lactuca saligna]|uniref:Uncharacterized protein n=1 Tax=Lactuca saligna TaxID=75948 RepID=A0AA36EGS7_LACSI|nr:unnamed protein product [Lactuca saligna]
MDVGGARFKFKKMKYEEFEEEWAKPCDFRSRFYLEGESGKNTHSKHELNAKSNNLPLDDAPSCIESMKSCEKPRKISLDLNSEDVSSSECGSTCGFMGEKESMRIWKQMKQNGFLSSSNGGVLVPQMPKPRGKKRGSISVISKKIEIAKKEQVDKFAKVAAPSGLLNELNPGIINHVRNRRQVHSIIENLVRSSRNKNKISKDVEDDVLALKLSSDSTMASENISSLSNEESGNISTVDSLSIKAASVACQWLELVHQDIKGRLAALRRSKKRVQSVIQTELPFLISMELYSPVGIEMHRFRWTALFDQMDKSLSEEEEHLEKSLDQVREMLTHCEHGLLPFPSEKGLQNNYIFQKVDRDLAVRAAAAAIYSTSNFLQPAQNLPGFMLLYLFRR